MNKDTRLALAGHVNIKPYLIRGLKIESRITGKQGKGDKNGG
jgi:hypothetical protein